MTDTEEGETFLSLCNTHMSDKRQDEGRSSEVTALALRLGGGMSHLSPFFGQWCPPGAIWSLLTTSALACPTVLLQKAVPTPGKRRGALRASAEIRPAHQGRRSDTQFTHHHPPARKGEFPKNSDSAKHLGGVLGVLSWVFERNCFFFVPGGKAYAFNSITIN